jgi:head-to-tail connecting protein
MPADPAAIIAKWRRAESRRHTVDATNQDIADYELPRRSWIRREHQEGQRQTDRQMDPSAELAGLRLAGMIMATAFSADQKWFTLKTRSEELNELAEVDEWLEACSERLWLAFNQSNFQAEMGEFLVDYVFFGTGSSFMEELTPSQAPMFGGFNFKASAPGTYCFEEGATGQVDTHYRTFEISARVAVDLWGKEKCGEDLVRKVDAGQGDEMQEVLHAIYPRDQRREDKRDYQNMPWASCYVLVKGSRLLKESGFQEFPIIAGRWSKASGEVYGRGPGHTAYPAVRTLCQHMENALRAEEKATDPPLTQLEGSVTGEVSLRPADITITNQPNAIMPLVSGARFDVAHEREDRLINQIREIFFHDLLTVKESPVETATAVLERKQLRLQALGSTAGRLQSEVATPMVSRGFGMMSRAKALPPPPAILLEQGAELDIQYEGPLARAARSNDAAAVRMWMADLFAMAEAGRPEAMDNANVDWLARHGADVLGVPAQGLQDPKIVQQARDARAQAVAQQQQARLALEAGKVAPGVMGALQKGSEQSAGAAA